MRIGLGMALFGMGMVAFWLIGCDRHQVGDEQVLGGAAMGTTWRLRYVGDERAGLDREIAGRLEEIEGIFSTWREGSLLSRLNRGEELPLPLPREFREVAELADEICELSGGAFDVGIGEKVAVAGFGSGLGGRLDYSGIAKGFAVDEIGSLLETRGIDSFLFELGGELLGRGARAWRVGLESPDTGSVGQVRQVISLHNQALATSGTYRQFRGDQNHLIDPRTGRSPAHDCVSVSVVADSCAEADALATALIVLGAEDGLALARRLGLQAIFVRRLADGSLEESGTEEAPCTGASPSS